MKDDEGRAQMAERMGAYLDQREALSAQRLTWSCPCGAYGVGAAATLSHQCPHVLDVARRKAAEGRGIGSLGGLSSTALGVSARRFTREEVLSVLRARKVMFPPEADLMGGGQQNELTALIHIFERME